MTVFERSRTLINKKFSEYLIPSILANAAISLAAIMEGILVGNRLGETELSVIGLSMPFSYTLMALVLIFSTGGSTCAAIAKGKRKTKDANAIFTLVFVAGVPVMIGFMLVFLLFLQPFTNFLAHGDTNLQPLLLPYITPMILAMPLVMLITCLGQFIRVDGRPRSAALILIVASVSCFAFCFIFLVILDMGIGGAGLAFLLGYVVGTFMIIPYLLSKRRSFRFIKLSGHDFSLLRGIADVGLSQAFTRFFSCMRTLVLNMLIMRYLGVAGMTAMVICINMNTFNTIFASATTSTMLPITGTLFGEKDYWGMRFTVRFSFIFVLIVATGLTLLLLLEPVFIGGLFGINSPDGIAAVSLALRLYSLSLIMNGVNAIMKSFFQATGRGKLASLVVILREFAFVALFAMLLVNWKPNLIWLAFVMAEASTILVILGIGAYTKKRDGIVLLEKTKDTSTAIDISIPTTIEAAVGFSKQVMQFCRENGIDELSAMRLGIAVEEMTVNTVKYGHKNIQGAIDVLVRIFDDEIILRLRDNGIPFDPTQYQKNEEKEFAAGGIELVRRLTKEISYSWQIGFNVSIIKIPRAALTK